MSYIGATRTNYFKVTDEEALRALLEKAACSDETGIDVFTEVIDEQKHFCFGCYGTIHGLEIGYKTNNGDDETDYDFDSFAKELQKLVVEGDAIIIFNAGFDKLRCVDGEATVITRAGYEEVSLSKIAVATAKKQLGNNEYSPRCEY